MKYFLLHIFLVTTIFFAANASIRLDFQPKPKDVNSKLIWFNHGNKGKVAFWVNQLEQFLKDYSSVKLSRNRYACSFEFAPGAGRACAVILENFYPCTSDNQFGYHRATPCVFLTIEQDNTGWTPETYKNVTELNQLPSTMPLALKYAIVEENQKKSSAGDSVWVSCEGENPSDIENLGPLGYVPQKGFQQYYFPYQNIEGFVKPLVAVWFELPHRGLVISVKCKAWAYNIPENEGLTRFEIMVD